MAWNKLGVKTTPSAETSSPAISDAIRRQLDDGGGSSPAPKRELSANYLLLLHLKTRLTLQEAADVLGISRSTAFERAKEFRRTKLVAADALPHLKDGDGTYVTWAQIDAYVAAGELAAGFTRPKHTSVGPLLLTLSTALRALEKAKG